MKEHTWIIEYVDGGHVDGDFWICKVCRASGGPSFGSQTTPIWKPFLADGTGLQLSEDCDIAEAQVETAKFIHEYYKSKYIQKRLRQSAMQQKKKH
jgi:hypothetical protein